MAKKKKSKKPQFEYKHPNERPRICACCGDPVRVMAEWFDENGDIFCGAACRRRKCSHWVVQAV